MPTLSNEETRRPPIGITPKELWVCERFVELKKAIFRYVEADFPVPQDWINEYNEHLKLLKEKSYV